MTQEQNGITREANFILLIGNDPITIYGGKNHYRPTTMVAKAMVSRLGPLVELLWHIDRHSESGADHASLELGS